MSLHRFSFRRPELAVDLVNSLEGKGLADASSGLFLAAPRRTGKSTFLREELVPEVVKRGWIAIYVDLWADLSRDPALLIADALKNEIARHEGLLKKILKSMGLSKVKIAGAQFELDNLGTPSGLTLSDALAYLSEATEKSIVLIIDEAQHALSSRDGLNAMFAVKAARDRLNQRSGDSRLYLILTGSHRDKLAHLVLKKDQPFFGGQVTSFPMLGRAFTDAYVDWINPLLATNNSFSKEDMYAAFEHIGFRPEILKALVAEVALEYRDAHNLGEIVKNESELLRNRLWKDFENEFMGLTAIQKAVFKVLILASKDFTPFGEEAMKSYQESVDSKVVLTAQTIQATLDSLREKNLIWKSARGTYALEDTSWREWLHKKVS
ncbi:MAG: ATP-binding protein [Chlamydiales bacterium]|nr:ATP-binding protein [Chlamydiales bacterium]